jgi:sporulation protein YlmC with PRC-barrel domain
MLRSVKSIQGYSVQATDGTIGHVDDFYFDDVNWTIRHLIVETGSWLNNRKVLIPPFAIGQANWETRSLTVRMSVEKVKDSPVIDIDRPISRQQEAEYFDYHSWPYYWAGSGMWGGSPGMMLPMQVSQEPEWSRNRMHPDRTPDQAPPSDGHLRSTREVIGYHIHATDGEMGHVDDFVVDDESWSIRYMVVDTSNWWLGKKILIAPEWVTAVRWLDRMAVVALSREIIKQSPSWNLEIPISPQYETQLVAYYGRHLHSDPMQNAS